MPDDNTIGRHLRALRESVPPQDVGLPSGVGRRRTPGLRRSELATLAGVSVEYLTRLEQGRDRNPSSQVLAALAGALRLTADQRSQLRDVVKSSGAPDPFFCPAESSSPHIVRAPLLALLRQLEPAPALLRSRVGDVLATTTAFERLAGPVGMLDGDLPNLANYVFTDPRARAAFPDWDAVADGWAAALLPAANTDDPYTRRLLDDLMIVGGDPFVSRFIAPPPRPAATAPLRLSHPEVGELRLVEELLETKDSGLQLVIMLPADDVTAAALDRLAGRQPGGLQSVTAARAGG